MRTSGFAATMKLEPDSERAQLYPDGRYPANTLVVVSRLASPAFLVEIEAVASS